MKSEDNSNDRRDRTRALHVSTPDSVPETSAGREGSRPTAMRFLLVQRREEHLPLQLLWVSARSPGRTRRRAEGPAEQRRRRRACVLVSQAYRPARVAPLRLRAAVGGKLRSVMGVSASWWSWSEGFVVPGTGSGFWSYRCAHGSGDHRCAEAADGAASIQLSREGRSSQPAITDSRNACKINTVAVAHAQLHNVFVRSAAGGNRT